MYFYNIIKIIFSSIYFKFSVFCKIIDKSISANWDQTPTRPIDDVYGGDWSAVGAGRKRPRDVEAELNPAFKKLRVSSDDQQPREPSPGPAAGAASGDQVMEDADGDVVPPMPTRPPPDAEIAAKAEEDERLHRLELENEEKQRQATLWATNMENDLNIDLLQMPGWDEKEFSTCQRKWMVKIHTDKQVNHPERLPHAQRLTLKLRECCDLYNPKPEIELSPEEAAEVEAAIAAAEEELAAEYPAEYPPPPPEGPPPGWTPPAEADATPSEAAPAGYVEVEPLSPLQ